MGAIRREILDPETEADIIVTEAPLERADGSVSRRLKLWIFQNLGGDEVCRLEVHRTAHLGTLSEVELEEAYMAALRVYR